MPKGKIKKEFETIKQKSVDRELIVKSEKSLFENIRKRLPEYMENRLNEISTELAEILNDDNNKGFETVQILNMIKQPKYCLGPAPKYSTEELFVIFEAYQKMTGYINKYVKFIPTKENFCRFAGIATSTFETYLNSNETDKKNIMRNILDYLIDINLSLAQDRKIDNITTIHRGKATLGMIEQQAPQIIEHQIVTDIDAIRANINAIRQGKSLRSEIDIDKPIYFIEDNKKGDNK